MASFAFKIDKDTKAAVVYFSIRSEYRSILSSMHAFLLNGTNLSSIAENENDYENIENASNRPNLWKNLLCSAGIGTDVVTVQTGINIRVGTLVTGSAATIAIATGVLKTIFAAIIGFASIGSCAALAIVLLQ